jgi:hypothetical protein
MWRVDNAVLGENAAKLISACLPLYFPAFLLSFTVSISSALQSVELGVGPVPRISDALALRMPDISDLEVAFEKMLIFIYSSQLGH